MYWTPINFLFACCIIMLVYWTSAYRLGLILAVTTSTGTVKEIYWVLVPVRRLFRFQYHINALIPAARLLREQVSVLSLMAARRWILLLILLFQRLLKFLWRIGRKKRAV